MAIVTNCSIASHSAERPERGTSRATSNTVSASIHPTELVRFGARVVLEISEAIRRTNGIDVGPDLPVEIAVADIADFQPGIFPEFTLDGQVILPTIRHLVACLAANVGTAETRA